jgi:hypothetical protein
MLKELRVRDTRNQNALETASGRRDLNSALEFVFRRIEEESTKSGEQLSGQQRFLLNHLPNNSTAYPAFGSEADPTVVLVPRDLGYERLCALARAAHDGDVRSNPEAETDWKFAAAVLKLNRHPMIWLLEWAGVKVRRPWWDRWLLVAGALVLILTSVFLMLLAGSEPWRWFQLAWVGGGYIVVIGLLYLASRRLEEWQLMQTINDIRQLAKHLP